MTVKTACFPAVAEHADLLSASGDGVIGHPHEHAMAEISAWITRQMARQAECSVIMVCTGNSRRSILGATMGNIAAATLDLPVRFFSGGTTPSAFNPRTIRALQAIGVQITATVEQAAEGTAEEPNPRYLIRWGAGEQSFAIEFSKTYDDPANPQHDFAAVMVCTDAEQNCPLVLGATLRVGMPFEDPKEFDGQPIEAEQYAARRDEIGRVLFQTLQRVRRPMAAP
ncbi:MAG: hypothetical protein DWH91_07195 [Planctomycetota bacterium]|nr:MAG: hypothetical protein DWH91_07195 [Planctomycetota bacterium]